MTSSIPSTLGDTLTDSPLRKAFLKWQCRVRQNAMRTNNGQPDDGIMPAVFLGEATEPMGHILSLIHI